jgi:hypothetical protein
MDAENQGASRGVRDQLGMYTIQESD